jgi:hypothetical protein
VKVSIVHRWGESDRAREESAEDGGERSAPGRLNLINTYYCRAVLVVQRARFGRSGKVLGTRASILAGVMVANVSSTRYRGRIRYYIAIHNVRIPCTYILSEWKEIQGPRRRATKIAAKVEV